MKIFMLDLWHDLQQKRLAPVAIALLLGLVAVPVLVAKPAKNAGPAPVPRVSAAQRDNANRALAALSQVKLGDTKVGSGSTLGVFDPDNPFKPPKGAIKKQTTSTGAGTASAGPGSANTGSSNSGTVGNSGGGVTSGGTTGGNTGGTTGGGPGGTDGTTTVTTVYKYVVDVTFEANGNTRHIKGLEKLDMLPSQDSPLLIFMGVTANGGNAVFMVDSSLKAAGEGKCKPSASQCAFAYIGAGSEYMFRNDDGDTYRVKIDEIRKVKVSPSGASAKAGAAKGAKAHASVGPQRRFVPPILADIVVVASDELADSNGETNNR
jgi:hypothetical protein